MEYQYAISKKNPPVGEYMQLRKSFGWTNGSVEDTLKSLDNSLFKICIEVNVEFAAFGRVVGDGILNFYIQDIMVKEKFRGMGFARAVMENIMKYINENAGYGSFIGIFSSPGLESMYEKFGFIRRPTDKAGAGMFKVV